MNHVATCTCLGGRFIKLRHVDKKAIDGVKDFIYAEHGNDDIKCLLKKEQQNIQTHSRR
jgi:hypothetical protein